MVSLGDSMLERIILRFGKMLLHMTSVARSGASIMRIVFCSSFWCIWTDLFLVELKSI
jgi:hypothetical protein